MINPYPFFQPLAGAITQGQFNSWVLPFSLMAVTMTLLGIVLPCLIFNSTRRRLKIAQGENLRLTALSGEIVSNQNELIASLTNKFGVEQKLWNMQLRDRESRIEELAEKLSQFDANSSTVRQEIAVRDERIRKLQLELNERLKEVDRLKAELASDAALAGRVNQLENFLKQREGEIRTLRGEHQTQIDQLANLLRQREAEAGSLRPQLDQLTLQLNAKNQEIASLSNALQARDQKIGELSQAAQGAPENQARLSQLEKLLAERDTEIQRLSQEMKEQEKDINELLAGRDEELNRLRAELQGSTESVASLENRQRELEKTLQEKTSDLNTYLRRVGEIEGLLSERESAILALHSEIDATKHLRDQHGRIRDLEIELTRLRRELADKSDLHSKLGHYEAQLRSREIELDRLRSELDASLRERDARFQEFDDLLRQKDHELTGIRGNLASADALRERIKDLEWQLSEKAGDTENNNRRIEELEYLLWEKDEQIKNLRGEKQNLKDAERRLGEKENELARLKDEIENAANKIRELEWILGERNGELEFLRREKSEAPSAESSALRGRIEELERSLREREGELERWWNENEALKNQISSHESEIEKLRRDRSLEPLHSRVEELEWLLSERDAEIERLGGRNHTPSFDHLALRLRDLERVLDQKESEIRRLRGDRESRPSSLNRAPFSSRADESRVRELERLLNERERELRSLRSDRERGRRENDFKSSPSDHRLAPDQDLKARVRQLEWLLEQRGDPESPRRRPGPLSPVHFHSPILEVERLPDRGRGGREEDAEYRFTLGDGSVAYIRGHQRIDHEGQTLTPAELFETFEEEERRPF